MSGRRRAATASSPRPTSTSSTPSTLAAHHDVELPLVTLAALERLHVDLGLPPVLMRVNNRQLAQGFYLGPGHRGPAGGAAPGRQARQDRARTGWSTLLVDDVGDHARPRPTPACALAQISTADESFVDRVRALGVEHAAARRGPGPAGRRGPHGRGATCPAGWSPTSRSPAAWTTTPARSTRPSWSATSRSGSISSGGRYDSLASDGKTTYPGVGLSIGVTRLLAPLLGQGVLRASRAGADRGAGRGRRRGDPRRRRSRSPSSCEPGASPPRWRRRPTSSASRSATPTGAASRTSGSARPARGEVKDIRSGDQAAGRPGTMDRRPSRTGGRPYARSTEPVPTISRHDVLRRRIATQRLRSGLTTAAEVVRLAHLRAVPGARPRASGRSGCGPPGSDYADVRAAFDAGAFVRTHILRPTWHFVAAEDLRWIQRVTAPRVQQLNGTVCRQRGPATGRRSTGQPR